MAPLAFSVSIDFYLAQIVVDNFLGALSQRFWWPFVVVIATGPEGLL
jgi:hypothetical protein